MRAKLKKTTVQLSGFLIAMALLATQDASAFRLRMEGGNSLRVETPAALYASDAGGHLVKIVARGARVPGGGTIADFGTPSIATDGSVYFGADVRSEGSAAWRIFRADPNQQEAFGLQYSELPKDPRPAVHCRRAIRSRSRAVIGRSCS
jgi:hypothetical protein